MRPTGPPLLQLAARLRPCHTSIFSARRYLATFSSQRLPAVSSCVSRSSLPFTQRRSLVTDSTSPVTSSNSEPPKPTSSTQAEPDVAPEEEEYYGPLTTTFRRLKILSLSSLTLTFALTPFIFVLETTSSVPLVGRFALAGIAMATSGVSTFLVAWCGRPYVTTLHWLTPDTAQAQAAGSGRVIEMTTLTLGLKKRVTTVYDTAFLVPTSRPFATWELAEAFRLPDSEVASAREQGLIPREETIAETRTKDGGLLGRWIVSWDEDGVGTCREIGQVTRYFNVHQELLSRPIR